MYDVKCPYCNKEIEINHDDGYGYEENELHDQECDYCNKTFVFDTSIHFFHEVYRADCLNGSEHDYKKTTTYPKEFTKLKCTICGHVKLLSS